MIDKLKVVLAQFKEDRTYIDDGYYRVKSFDDGSYELEFSVSGSCGTFDSHPAIKIALSTETDDVTYLLYRDMVVSPIEFFKPESEAELAFVKLAFEQLVDKFYSLKQAH